MEDNEGAPDMDREPPERSAPAPWRAVPTLLTWLRIVLVPLCVVLFYAPVAWGRAAAACVFLAASVTDWLDGYLARRMGQTTAFGAFLDPVADKLMVSAALLLVVESTARTQSPAWSLLVAIAAMVIVGRELVVSALREWMAALGATAQVAVSATGKVKTAVQMIALVVLLLGDALGLPLLPLGAGLLLFAAVLTLASMLRYLQAAWPTIRAVRGAGDA
jgi:CDP-diacylglycerol--glycerol-3-phosphate 3-phosphatidyltransferase